MPRRSITIRDWRPVWNIPRRIVIHALIICSVIQVGYVLSQCLKTNPDPKICGKVNPIQLESESTRISTIGAVTFNFFSSEHGLQPLIDTMVKLAFFQLDKYIRGQMSLAEVEHMPKLLNRELALTIWWLLWCGGSSLYKFWLWFSSKLWFLLVLEGFIQGVLLVLVSSQLCQLLTILGYIMRWRRR